MPVPATPPPIPPVEHPVPRIQEQQYGKTISWEDAVKLSTTNVIEQDSINPLVQKYKEFVEKHKVVFEDYYAEGVDRTELKVDLKNLLNIPLNYKIGIVDSDKNGGSAESHIKKGDYPGAVDENILFINVRNGEKECFIEFVVDNGKIIIVPYPIKGDEFEVKREEVPSSLRKLLD